MAGKKSRNASSSSSTPPSPAPSISSRRSSVRPPQQAYKRPKQLNIFTRSLIWYESSFAISMLEPWEKWLLHTFLFILLLFLYFAGTTYLPATIGRLRERVMFYVYGYEEKALEL